MLLNLCDVIGPGLGWTLPDRNSKRQRIMHLRDSNGRKMKLGNKKW